MSHNDVQKSCTGYDFAFGEIYGLRQFGYQKRSRRLTGCVRQEPWSKTTTARCLARREIGPTTYDRYKREGRDVVKVGNGWSSEYYAITPCLGLDPSCTCGLYAYHDVRAMDQNSYYNAAFYGVVKTYGKVTIGTKGVRAEKADLVAICGIESSPAHELATIDQKQRHKRMIKIARNDLDQYEVWLERLQKDLARRKARQTSDESSRSLTTLRVLQRLFAGLGTLLFPTVLLADVNNVFASVLAIYLFVMAVVGFGIFLADRKINKLDPTFINLLTKIDVDKKRIAQTKQQIKRHEKAYAKADSVKTISVKPVYRISELQGRAVARKYGVPYYSSRSEMLRNHPLTGREALGIRENPYHSYQSKNLNFLSDAQRLEILKQLIKDLGV